VKFAADGKDSAMKKSAIGVGIGLLAAVGVLGYGLSAEKETRRQLAVQLNEARQTLEGNQAELMNAREAIRTWESRAGALETELNHAKSLLSSAQERIAKYEAAVRPSAQGQLTLSGRNPATEPGAAMEVVGPPPPPPAAPRPRPPGALRLVEPQ
jgi:hypothetical protein